MCRGRGTATARPGRRASGRPAGRGDPLAAARCPAGASRSAQPVSTRPAEPDRDQARPGPQTQWHQRPSCRTAMARKRQWLVVVARPCGCGRPGAGQPVAECGAWTQLSRPSTECCADRSVTASPVSSASPMRQSDRQPAVPGAGAAGAVDRHQRRDRIRSHATQARLSAAVRHAFRRAEHRGRRLAEPERLDARSGAGQACRSWSGSTAAPSPTATRRYRCTTGTRSPGTA